MRHSIRFLLAVLALFGLLAAACGDDGEGEQPDASAPALAGELTVFAAASLTESFTEIGEAFEAEHPGTSVRFSFAASSALAQQILEGAPADVFASADAANMQKLTDAGEARGVPELFATNALEIITAPGNPKNITGVADLADPGLVVVTCTPEVPIGRYAAEVFAASGVTVTPKSYEADVKAVVAKVVLGEADAGVVYATDVAAAGGDAAGVPIPEDVNVVATYPIAVTEEADDVALAGAFVDFVLSGAGQAILTRAGFAAP